MSIEGQIELLKADLLKARMMLTPFLRLDRSRHIDEIFMTLGRRYGQIVTAMASKKITCMQDHLVLTTRALIEESKNQLEKQLEKQLAK